MKMKKMKKVKERLGSDHRSKLNRQGYREVINRTLMVLSTFGSLILKSFIWVWVWVCGAGGGGLRYLQ